MDVRSQPIQPSYLGKAMWHQVAGQTKPEPLAFTQESYPVSRTTTRDSSLAMVKETIDPGTVILHKGPTLPVVQTIRFTGKKLAAPKVFPAPPLLNRDNAGFNISYSDKRHGFPAVITTDIAEDKAHHIWMATDNGVIRYDGSQYYVYDQTNGLPDMTESSLVYDQLDRLWVVSGNGAYFIRHDSVFSIRSPEIDFSGMACNKVEKDRLNRVWISTSLNGVICVDGPTIRIYDKRCGLPLNNFQSVFLDKKGNLYLASTGSGLILIEPGSMRMLFSSNKKMKPHIFISLYEDEDGIWAGTFFSGLVQLGPKDTVRYSIDGKFSERIYGIRKKAGGMWLSCYSQGLCYFDKQKLLFINQNNGLVNNYPYRIFKDSFQNLWVSSGSSGFSRVNETGFYLQPYSNHHIGFTNRLIPDGKNGYWITAYGRGLLNHRGNTTTSYTFQQKQGSDPLKYINDALVNKQGDLWIANYDLGIIRLAGNRFTLFKYQAPHGTLVALSVKEDTAKSLWFNPVKSGLLLYKQGRFWQYAEKSGLLSNDVTGLFLDAGKEIHWSFAEGLQRFHGPIMETFYIGDQLFKDKVNSMIALDRDRLLLATTINGLLLLHEGKVYRFSTDHGFTSNTIKMMIQDVTGNIWVTTEKGIESFRMNGIAVTDHRIFNVSDGPYIMDVKYALLDSTGLPFWSEREYKMVFDSSLLNSKKISPLFSFNQIRSNNRIVPVNDPISILPDQLIRIDYSTIYWGRENNLHLTYLLISEKKDTTIRNIPNNGSIIISDALPGKYRILLRAADNNDIFYSQPLGFSVSEFWYDTWTFRIIAGFLIIAAIIVYFRQRGKEQLRTNEMLGQKVLEQTGLLVKEKDALLHSYHTIDLQNKEKDALIDEINHRVKNNLQFISAILEMQVGKELSREVIQALLGTSRRIKAMSLVHELLNNKHILKGISIRTYIQELVDNLKEVAVDESRPVKIIMDIDDLQMDSSTTLPLGMIISELVSNSFKHAFAGIPDPEVRIRLKKDIATGSYHLIVSDNGNGYQPSARPSGGLGQNLVDIFSRQLQGQYTLETEGHFSYELHFKIIET